MSAPSSMCASLSIHAAALVALILCDASAPQAPPISGGTSGGEGPSFHVAIRGRGADLARDGARAARFAPQSPAPPAVAVGDIALQERSSEERAAAPARIGGDAEWGGVAVAAGHAAPRASAREAIAAAVAGGGAAEAEPAIPEPPSPPGLPGASGTGSDSPVVDGPDAMHPVYPAACLREGHAGTTRVRFVVGADGVPFDLVVVRSAGCPDLDAAALEAVRKARFRPARWFGRAVPAPVEQEFRFEIRPGA